MAYRDGKVEEAVTWAQQHLWGLAASLPPALVATLREAAALLAYETPSTCPASHLLSQSQRERVADRLNTALLAAASGRGPQHTPQVRA